MKFHVDKKGFVVLFSKSSMSVETVHSGKKQSAMSVQREARGKNTIPVLDGLRAIATLMVISFHIQQKAFIWGRWSQPWISAFWTFGGSGVTLFFVLSGFLLFLPYAKALLFESSWPSIKQFYIRRTLRILPAYYIALFVIILLFQRQYLNPKLWGQLFLFLTLFMDSTPQTFHALNGPFWTLAVEWQFYLPLPLIALAFLFCVRRIASTPRRRLLAISGCCLLLIAWGLFIRRIGLHYQRVPTSSPFINIALFFLYGCGGKYLENFAVGMALSACYVFGKNSEHGQTFLRWMRRISIPFGVIGLLLFTFTAVWHFYMLEAKPSIFSYFSHTFLVNTFFWLYEMVIALAYGSMMFALLFGYQAIKRPFEWRLLGWIGLLSYGLYMWHLPWIQFFESNVLHLLPPLSILSAYGAYWIWVALVVVPIALLSYWLIEKPCIQLGHRKAATGEVRAEVAAEQEMPVATRAD